MRSWARLGTCVAAISAVAVACALAGERYDRSEWLPRWADADRDCQDTRQEVLIEENVGTLLLSEDGCRVLRGTWLDPYSGDVVTDPRRLDVDHLVPLEASSRSGGAAWPAEKKRAYANDLEHPEHLVAVGASLNRQKGSRGPESWRPPRRECWCWYARSWRGIKARWGLSTTEPERRAIAEMLVTCEDEPSPRPAPQAVHEHGEIRVLPEVMP